jgi:rhamnosyltransferase
MSFCILISTYNGSKFIKDQLDSIRDQKAYDDIEVFIRDDESSDNTISLVKDYSQQFKMKISLYQGENRGPSDSFLDLINKAPEAEYYAFCDQDDAWIPGKIATAEEALAPLSCPALWFSNYDVTDDKLNVIEEQALTEPEKNQLKALFYNNVPGCTMVFNRALLVELRKLNINHFRMHDILALCVALISGKVIYNNTSYIYYRQHSGNAVGRYSKKIKPFKWVRDKLGVISSNDSFNYAMYARRIIEVYGDILSSEIKNEYNLIANYKKGFNRIRLLKKEYTVGRGGRTSKSIRMRILLGKI